uniref:Uncharacterized protein n=1 Tax=viral metagenome TaxID=1070528 RepID=A0A6M3LD22_9ZZZZ
MEHTIRSKDGTLIDVPKYSPKKAMRAFCSECLGWVGNAKTDCTSPNCPIYPFRGRYQHVTEEQREQMRQRALGNDALIAGRKAFLQTDDTAKPFA